MATTMIPEVTSDVSDEPGARRTTFVNNLVHYEVDLLPEEMVQVVEGTLSPRKLARSGRALGPSVPVAQIRSWAMERGLIEKDKSLGRVPNTVLAAWVDKHPPQDRLQRLVWIDEGPGFGEG